MIIEVNGTTRDVDAQASVKDVVANFSKRPHGIAVAVNGTVVPRSQWERRSLEAGDRVEVLTAVGGG